MEHDELLGADPWYDYDVGQEDDDEDLIYDLLDAGDDEDDEMLGIDQETAEMLGIPWGKIARIARRGAGALAKASPGISLIRRAFSAGRRTAPRRRPSRRALTSRAMGGVANQRQAAYAAKLSAGRYGASQAGAKEWPLPFPAVVFTDASPTSVTIDARPQRLFRGRRPFIIVTRSAGAAAVAVSLTALTVGAENQLVAAGSLPAEAFGPTAFDTRLVMTAASPGIDITITFSVSPAVPAGETVTVLTSIHGDSWGS